MRSLDQTWHWDKREEGRGLDEQFRSNLAMGTKERDGEGWLRSSDQAWPLGQKTGMERAC